MEVAVRGPSKTRRVPLGAPAFFPVGEETSKSARLRTWDRLLEDRLTAPFMAVSECMRFSTWSFQGFSPSRAYF